MHFGNILNICGSLNQTTSRQKIYSEPPKFGSYLTTFYCEGIIKFLAEINLIDFIILGRKFKKGTIDCLDEFNLKFDCVDTDSYYNFINTCSETIILKNILGKKPRAKINHFHTANAGFPYSIKNK